MLKERVITALVLLAIVIPCLFWPGTSLPFAAFAGVLVTAGAWEWTRMMGWSQPVARAAFATLVLALVVACAGVVLYGSNAASLTKMLCGISVGFWLVALRWVVNYPEKTERWSSAPIMFPVGLILLVPAFMALLSLHQISHWWLLYLFGLVWGADSGAYFAGRAFGSTKLAPDVSPGKTLEGMLGGLALTLVLALVVAFWHGVPGSRFLAFMVLSLFTVLASVLGDLLESMVKRKAGIKDSGTIFPGHGGALDRIDSLTAAAPVFVLGWLLAGGF